MAQICELCGKRPVAGRTYTHSGMPKKQGGVGRRTRRKNLRRFSPNLKRVKTMIGGTRRRILVCTACLKSGRVVKAPARVRVS